MAEPKPSPTEARLQENRDTRPTPDPTVLTTQLVLREIAAVKDILETRMQCTEEKVGAMSLLIEHRQDAIKEGVGHLHELHSEKFAGIQKQFVERDARTEQNGRDSNTALTAALNAQKEAVAKAEVGFTKQIEGINLLMQSSSKATDDKFNDLKDRLTIIESHKQGSNAAWGYVIGGVGIIVAIATAVIMSLQIHAGK